MHFILAFGIAFLLPVLLMLLERAGLVTRDQLKRGRRYAILGAFVVAAVATPPDVVSPAACSPIPLILLYELSLIAIWFTERKRAKEAAARRLRPDRRPSEGWDPGMNARRFTPGPSLRWGDGLIAPRPHSAAKAFVNLLS